MPTDHSSALALSATIVLTVLASAAAAQQGGADQSSPPPPPAWVDADGKVKPESAPREVPMVGREGKLLKDDKGYDKMVPSSHRGDAAAPDESGRAARRRRPGFAAACPDLGGRGRQSEDGLRAA